MGTVQQYIDDWYTQHRDYFYRLKDGYHELSYLAESPELMLQSLPLIPGFRAEPELDKISTNTEYAEGIFYYRELEEGFWLMCNKMRYKQNISFNIQYDPQYGAEFYNVGHAQSETKAEELGCQVGTQTPFNHYWICTLPRQLHKAYHLAGTYHFTLLFYISADWLERNIAARSKAWQHFIQSGASSIFFQDQLPLIDTLKQRLWDCFSKQGGPQLELKMIGLELFQVYLQQYEASSTRTNNLLLSGHDIHRMLTVEQELQHSLRGKFPGIEELAQKHHISPSKLKRDFKNYFGKSTLQYYKEQQMQYAHKILADDKTLIKELALELGYENAGKFSRAFKKQFGYLPNVLVKTG